MSNVASLWIGEQLSIPHKIALSSFLYHGHNVKLYVYDNSIAVPKGVVKEDARKILGEDKVFTHFGKYAAFSDFFRYAMIAKTGETWIDTDMFCFSDDLLDSKEYIFVEESQNDYCGNILKLPQHSDIIKWLYVESKNILKQIGPSPYQISDKEFSREYWVFLGPGLLTKAVNKFALNNHAISLDKGHMIDIHHDDPRDIFWNPSYLDIAIEKINSAQFGSFFNSWLDQRGFEKNKVVSGSAMGWLMGKYLVGDDNE